MASPRRYLERDLFELGYTNQKMIERVHGFWHYQLCQDPIEEIYDREDCILPSLLRQYVPAVCSWLQQLSRKELGARVQSLATHAESLLTQAWRKYQRRWKSLTDHKLQQAQASVKEYPDLSQELMGSPLVTKEWTEYRQSLGVLFAAIEGSVARWAELGSLVAQVETLWGARQPKILGEPFPLPALQDALRDARDSESALAELDVELADPETNVEGFPELDYVKPKVETIRQAIRGRLAGGTAPEAVPGAKSKKERGKWPITRTEPKVAQYLSEHAGLYKKLVPGVLAGDAKKCKEFRAKFGATAIAEAITKKASGGKEDSCGKSHVQKTAPYRHYVSPLLKIPPESPVGWRSEAEKADFHDFFQDLSLE